MKRIIFVDDEEHVLQGLKRMLRSVRQDWNVTLAESGKAALEIMEREEPFDMVVSDMQMPGMDGVEFLTQVMKRHPHTVRFGLSGHADAQTQLRAGNITHQFLSKPCDPQLLQNLIARAITLREHLGNDNLKQIVFEIGSLPSLPALYGEIMDEINSSDPSVARVGEIIKKDVGISAKVLQFVNSAYMGVRHEISDVVHAATLLGLEHVKGIVLMVGVFSQFAEKSVAKNFSLDALWGHSSKVGEFAMRIAEDQTEERRVADDAFTSGLLHDIGQLILGSKMSDKFGEAMARAREQQIPLSEAEKDIFGATHAAVGGYLLDLWGLPDPIVEAITFHDYPSANPEEEYAVSLGNGLSDSSEDGFSALTAVHVANYFCAEDGADADEWLKAEIDEAYLERLGLIDSVEEWWDLCQEAG